MFAYIVSMPALEWKCSTSNSGEIQNLLFFITRKKLNDIFSYWTPISNASMTSTVPPQLTSPAASLNENRAMSSATDALYGIDIWQMWLCCFLY